MGFRYRPADLWKLGARSLPKQQPPPARAPAGALLIEFVMGTPEHLFVAFVAAASPASLVWAGAIAFSWLPRLAHNFARRFGSLAAPFLRFLDTDDSTSAKLHRARRQSGLLQLIEKREANADGGAEFLD